MSDMTKIYVSDGQGKFFQEVQDADGEFEYIPADPALMFEEVRTADHKATGKYIEVRDLGERRRQLAGDSHQQYFENLSKNPDPKVARQAMKRQDYLEKQFQQMAIDRVSPVGVPSVEYVKDERFMELLEQFKKDQAKGLTKDPDYAEQMFLPLPAYQHKLVTKSGTMIRPLYTGEVGMQGAKIVCLEAGYGTGNLVTVAK